MQKRSSTQTNAIRAPVHNNINKLLGEFECKQTAWYELLHIAFDCVFSLLCHVYD